MTGFDGVVAPLDPSPPLDATTAVLDGPDSVTPAALLATFSATLDREPRADDETPALVVGTSGSTGRAKHTVLSRRALRSSGLATEEVTGTVAGAQWLLALPTHFVAGAQVIARSALAGTTPVVTESVLAGTHFGARDFLTCCAALTGRRLMTSLVPTQLHTLLAEADGGIVAADELHAALRGFAAILLGGAPASAALLSRCAELRVPVVLTYGSAETAGGCVYDGRPLPGVRVAVDAAAGESGRIWLGGPTLASGYLDDVGRTAAAFGRDTAGRTWYRTDDLGRLTSDGLQVLGRVDDVIITGGVKVSARAVASVLEHDPAVREALVVGVPDPRWGREVRAAVSRGTADPDPDRLRRAVGEQLGAHAVPKRIVVLDQLPATSTGKPDRAAVARLLRD